MKKPFIGMCLLLLGTVNPASANDKYTLSISPLHLFAPIVELTLESPIAPGVSIAGILGYGSITVESKPKNEKFSLFEAGGQLRYYPGADSSSGFHGGLEAMYIRPILDDQPENVTVSVNGFAVGPLVGYKWAYDSGMIFDFQLGYQWLFGQVKAEDSAGNEVEGSVEDGAMLLNLNLGFAF